MKVEELARKYGVDKTVVIKCINDNKIPLKSSFLGELYTDNPDVDKYLTKYVKELKQKEEEEYEFQKREIEENATKKKAMSQMLITSGFNFDGYHIVKYSGYISGDDAISVDRGMAVFGAGGTNVKDKLMESLAIIRRNALRELKEAAYDVGCNAVIGVDFDYLTLDPQTANISGGTTYQPYVFGVTANGNAVIIEKDN